MKRGVEMNLIRARYKVTGVLRAEEAYAALRAVNIESGGAREYLLNVYEGAQARRYASCFDHLRRSPELCEVFVTDGALISVFSYTDAPDIDRMFYKGAPVGWRERVNYAQLLLHLALSVSDYPAEIACAAFYSGNLIPLPKEGALAVNFAVSPAPANTRELMYLLTDQIKKVFLRRFGSPSAELDFTEELESWRYDTVGKIYSRWQEVKRAIEEEYEALERMNALKRTIKLALAALQRRVVKRKGGTR
jgi:hypothetical protein